MLTLEDIRILDLSRMVAGPFCSMALGDLGAEVIKIEQPGTGDDTRKWGPPFVNGESTYFLSVNRNKKSLTLDLKKEKAREIFRELVRRSDVVLENFKTGTMEKFQLGYSELRNFRPELIYCSITGFGLSGPYKNKAGTDPVLQAMGGLMGITGEPDGKPMRIPLAIIDMATGLYAHGAIMAALIARGKTGQGQFIEISLLDTELTLLLNLASSYLIAGELPKRWGSAHPTIVPFGVFETRDRAIFLSASSDGRWRRLCEACEMDHLADDQRFRTTTARTEHRNEVVTLLQEKLRHKTAEEWLSILDNAGVPCAPINTLDRVFQDPHVTARGIVTEVDHPLTGTVKMVGIPVRYYETPGAIRLPPPRLGEHNDEILRELLGYTENAIDSLRREEVI
ncbi:MAG: CoA transferase [Deltaproteobacteria bacterium]|nr:CoA transferase [Deltaproteobacteria bacterium]MBW2308349.1 CoA transferase [Deltaproteobacteria bacterium]